MVLFQVPFVAWLSTSMLQPIRVVLPKLQTPLADGLVRHIDTAFKQQLLHIAIAQGEAIVEPDPMADDLAGKAAMFVALVVGRRAHGGLPILRCEGVERNHRRSDYVMGQEAGSTT